MPSESQAGRDSEYDSIYHRQLAQLSDRELCSIQIHRKETAVDWWNAVNRYDVSDDVYEHFRQQLPNVKD